MPLTDDTQIHLTGLSLDKTNTNLFSNTELSQVEKLSLEGDPAIGLSTTSLGLVAGNPKQGVDGLLDFNLGDETKYQEKRPVDLGLSDHIGLNNVLSLNRSDDVEVTKILEKEDETVQLLDGGDTVVVQGDQGKLLQFESPNADNRDITALYQSDGGKIRQVEPNSLETSRFDHSRETTGTDDTVQSSSIDTEEYRIVTSLLERYQGRKRCLYLLPDDKLLVLNLSYPIQAIENIKSVLKYDLEKHIPLSFQEIRYFYALSINNESKKVDAEVAVIKSDEFNLLSLAMEPFVKKGLFCTTEKFLSKYGSTINFLEHRIEKNWQSMFSFSNLHLGFNWVLFLLLMVLPFLLFYQSFESIERKSPQEISRAKALVTTFNSINAESNFGSELAEKINVSPRATELISMLSSDLSKQAWLTRFTLKDNQIKIKGEADSATAVSDDLNKMGLFKTIKFVSSIVKNPRSGKETFELLLVLKNDA
ncbi:MAG: PilN domain-containing protein [Gammaproteobacteria bacterium]|nr:PilN domain-containing protein [Gammaproteobacteria bacterium]